MYHFGESINYNHDLVLLSLSPRDAGDKVQTHILMYNQTAQPHGYTKGTRLKRKERKGKEMEHFGK